MSEEKKRILVKQNDKPCGCVIREWSEGPKEVAPCVPCGLFAAANSIGQIGEAAAQAASALAAVATTMRNRSSLQAAAEMAVRPRIVR